MLTVIGRSESVGQVCCVLDTDAEGGDHRFSTLARGTDRATRGLRPVPPRPAQGPAHLQGTHATTSRDCCLGADWPTPVQTVGRNYADVVLQPHFKSIIRELTSAHEAKGLYTAQV